MNFKIEIKTDRPIAQVREETLAYFQKQGFRLTKNQPNHVEFEQGGGWQNMMTFNPLEWKSVSTFTFSAEKVVGSIDINTIHQMVTKEEAQMWKIFVSNYQKSMETGDSLIAETQKELKKTKKSSLKYAKYGLMGAILCGIPSGILAYQTGFNMLAPIGTTIGALSFLNYKIKKDWENG